MRKLICYRLYCRIADTKLVEERGRTHWQQVRVFRVSSITRSWGGRSSFRPSFDEQICSILFDQCKKVAQYEQKNYIMCTAKELIVCGSLQVKLLWLAGEKQPEEGCVEGGMTAPAAPAVFRPVPSQPQLPLNHLERPG